MKITASGSASIAPTTLQRPAEDKATPSTDSTPDTFESAGPFTATASALGKSLGGLIDKGMAWTAKPEISTKMLRNVAIGVGLGALAGYEGGVLATALGGIPLMAGLGAVVGCNVATQSAQRQIEDGSLDRYSSRVALKVVAGVSAGIALGFAGAAYSLNLPATVACVGIGGALGVALTQNVWGQFTSGIDRI